jgi:hypothetical protein
VAVSVSVTPAVGALSANDGAVVSVSVYEAEAPGPSVAVLVQETDPALFVQPGAETNVVPFGKLSKVSV